MVKNLLANAGDSRDVGSIPGSGRSPGSSLQGLSSGPTTDWMAWSHLFISGGSDSKDSACNAGDWVRSLD